MISGERARRVELTQRALSELREIERFSVREWGRKTADKYLDALASALDRLRANPELMRPAPEIIPGLCFYRVNKHVLVLDYRDDLIIVLTVIHTSMDLPARLLELAPQLAAEAQILREKLHGPSREG